MKHLKIETEDGAVIEYRYKDVEQLKRLLPRSLRIKIGSDVELGNYVLIRENVKIGDGCIIGDDVEICSDVKIGNNVQIGAWCTIMDGVRIKDNAYLSPATDVTGE